MNACLHCRYPLVSRPSRLVEGTSVLEAPVRPGAARLICWERPGTEKSHQPGPSHDEQVEEALAAVKTGVQDSRGDFPDLHDDDRYHEIASSVLVGYPQAVQVEVQRRLGFSPADF